MATLISVTKVDILSYSVDQGKTQQSTDFYQVIFDGPAVAINAETATGVPVYGDASPDDPDRLFKQKRASVIDNANRTHWMVQVDYDSAIETWTNPLSKPADITWDYSEGTENYFFDHGSLYASTDKRVTSSAGEPFDKLPERENGTWSSTFVKNVASTFSIATEINAMQVVNSGTFTYDGNTIAAYAAKISGGGLSPVQQETSPAGGIVKWRTLTYKLKFKVGGWIDKFEDRGIMEFDGVGPSGVKPILFGVPPKPIDKPWPLDGAGAKKAHITDKGAELDFYPYINMSFSGFGFV